jgi:hypothetical protein
MINPSDKLSVPVTRDSYIVGKIEIDGMGRILLSDVTIKYNRLTLQLFDWRHDERCTT